VPAARVPSQRVDRATTAAVRLDGTAVLVQVPDDEATLGEVAAALLGGALTAAPDVASDVIGHRYAS